MLPFALAIGLVIFYAASFYPGAMGFDAAYQWWQARGGETSNIHGVAMTWWWRMGGLLAPGPGPLFFSQLVLFWTGIVLIARSLPIAVGWRMSFVFIIAAAPADFVLFSSVVSDAIFVALLTCAVGIMLHARVAHRRLWLAVACVLLFAAFLLRKNAPPAILSLLVYCFFLDGRRFLRSAIAAVCALAIMQTAGWLLDRTADRQTTMLPATALWDLASISIDTDRIQLPSASHGPGLTVDDLRNAFVPYANTTIFAQTHAGMRQPFLDPADPLNDEIRQAWIGAIIDHPADYLAHRWRLTRLLFGSKQHEWPRELIYFPDDYQYDHNPPVEPNATTAHTWFLRMFDQAYDTVIFAAWPYLALGVIAGICAWRRRRQPAAQAALAILASGLCYALPLLLIAPSAELRYVGWTCVASILGAALAFSTRRTPVPLLRLNGDGNSVAGD